MGMFQKFIGIYVGFKKNIIAVKYSRESAQITIKKQKSGA
jgi:hypothetical protein